MRRIEGGAYHAGLRFFPAGRSHLRIIRYAAGERERSENQALRQQSTGAPRIHWFSPLAPSHTGIADFTRCLLPALCAGAEVTLWTDQEEWSAEFAGPAEVRRFDPAGLREEMLGDGATFYNIGNNSRFHAAIWEAARRFPGFVIMHDVFMHDSVAHRYQLKGDRAGYLEMMHSLYGARGRRDAELYWDKVLAMPQMGRLYTCAPFILDDSLGAIVHSRMAERTLRRELDLPVFRLPLPAPARRGPQPPHNGAPPWRLVVFGYLSVNRCIEQILTAVAHLAGRRLFLLDIYGDVEDRAGVEGLIERLGIEDLVTIHGYVPEEELDRALASAHLAINLRFPTKGEASYSQLRIWSHALPSLVSRIGWYAELPEDTVVFVRPTHLVEDICARLDEYAAAPESFVKVGLEGHRYFVEEHSPERYAAAIADLAACERAYRNRWNAARLADRATNALEGWFDPGNLPDFVDRVASVAGELSGCE